MEFGGGCTQGNFAEFTALVWATNLQGQVPGIKWRQHTGWASPRELFWSGPETPEDKFLELGGVNTQGRGPPHSSHGLRLGLRNAIPRRTLLWPPSHWHRPHARALRGKRAVGKEVRRGAQWSKLHGFTHDLGSAQQAPSTLTRA